MTEQLLPRDVAFAYGVPVTATVSKLTGGLINQTLLVEFSGKKLIVQRLNPIFAPEVHLDIDAITMHLVREGIPTPVLVPNVYETLYFQNPTYGVWRALSYLPGRTFSTAQSDELAEAAGALVARFHRAVSGLAHTFHFSRPGAHDTPAHLATLARALDEQRLHPRYDVVAPLAEEILQRGSQLARFPQLPTRIVHGDLKLSNLLFDENRIEGVALLDLDTMAHSTIPIELGDAFRSWCNPLGEDSPSEAVLHTGRFAAALRGYARASEGLLTEAEQGALVLGVETISLELAARFCADALYERYFGWDEMRFATRGEHNAHRARVQLSVSASVSGRRTMLEELVQHAFQQAR